MTRCSPRAGTSRRGNEGDKTIRAGIPARRSTPGRAQQQQRLRRMTLSLPLIEAPASLRPPSGTPRRIRSEHAWPECGHAQDRRAVSVRLEDAAAEDWIVADPGTCDHAQRVRVLCGGRVLAADRAHRHPLGGGLVAGRERAGRLAGHAAGRGPVGPGGGAGAGVAREHADATDPHLRVPGQSAETRLLTLGYGRWKRWCATTGPWTTGPNPRDSLPAGVPLDVSVHECGVRDN